MEYEGLNCNAFIFVSFGLSVNNLNPGLTGEFTIWEMKAFMENMMIVFLDLVKIRV